MFKLTKIFPRDIIALVTLIACFILMALGINKIVSGIVIMVTTFYFSKRLYEEKHPNGDLKDKVDKILKDVQQNKEETKQIKSYMPKPLPPGEVIVKQII